MITKCSSGVALRSSAVTTTAALSYHISGRRSRDLGAVTLVGKRNGP
jgi:hypothetical protein